MKNQTGFTFIEFIVKGGLLFIVIFCGYKFVPAYIENREIQKIFEVMSRDPAMQHASIAEIKDSFVKRAKKIKNIKTDDLEIAKDGDTLFLSAQYSKVVPLIGNTFVIMDFNPRAPH